LHSKKEIASTGVSPKKDKIEKSGQNKYTWN
jgi:hypothetical protein